MLYSPWHCKESDTTKRLLLTHSQNKVISSQVALVVKNPPTNAGDTRVVGLIPGLESPTGGRNGNSLQYSCLGNFMGRGAW